MSQVVGNEPLAGLFAAWTVLLLLRIVHRPRDAAPPPPSAFCVLLGVVWGLAALQGDCRADGARDRWRRGVCAVQPRIERRRRGTPRPHRCRRGRSQRLVLPARWIVLGKPFVAGWDPLNPVQWWQDPGYRTLDELTASAIRWFSQSTRLRTGFWDAVYSTMWADGYISGSAAVEAGPRGTIGS